MDIQSERLKQRVEELIAMADHALMSHEKGLGFGEAYEQFTSASVSFLKRQIGEDDYYFRRFMEIKGTTIYDAKDARGILKGLWTDIDKEWLTTAKEKLSKEIFSDYLEMAENLIEEYQEGFIPAAVIAGTTLEERIRQLCKKFHLSIEDAKNKPLQAETMNQSLQRYYTGTVNDKKKVTGWLADRNMAAHGNWNNISEAQMKQVKSDQVKLMIQGIKIFIAANPV